MAINPNNLLGQSNPNGTVGVSLGIDPAGANEAFSAGVTSGFVVRPNSPAGMTVKVGGESGVVDSALVRSPAGITFPVGNVSGTAIELAVPAAPSTNSRIDSVVLYVDTSVEATETDGADALGMEIVSGTSASTPVPPTDQQIRAAIEDGASIAYVVIANITVASGATTITQSDIENTNRSTLGADKVDFATTDGTVTASITTLSNNSWVKIHPAGFGILYIYINPSGSLPSGQETTIARASVAPVINMTVHMPLQGVTSGSQCGLVSFKTNGDVLFYNLNSAAYKNWIRATIPFFVSN